MRSQDQLGRAANRRRPGVASEGSAGLMEMSPSAWRRGMPRATPKQRWLMLVALAPFGTLPVGCASAMTGATFGSGISDTYFERPPYLAIGVPLSGGRIVHVPVQYQRGAVQEPMFDPATGPGTPVGALLEEMNAYLDGLGWTSPVTDPPAGTPPDVMFGCERSPGDECEAATERQPHRLAVGRPSPSWVSWARDAATAANADYVLTITLEVGHYLPRQRNLRGDKEVLLGAGHAQPVRWLTALDRPVSVLQVTGALISPDGRAVRIAAEGLTAHATHVLAGGFGVQALISDADVEHVRTARRPDLPGSPLVWEAALRRIVVALTGQPDPEDAD